MKVSIDDYIKHSRIEKELPESYRERQLLYKRMYNRLSKIAEGSIAFPKLHCCYTLKKTCEMVSFNDDEAYLVYDMSLGRYMSYMNNLMLFPDTSSDHIEWFYRMCEAEYFCSENELELAYYTKLYADVIQEFHSKKMDISGISHSSEKTMTFLQECFVMLHEVSHYRLSRLSRSDYNMEIKKMREWILSTEPKQKTNNDSDEDLEFYLGNVPKEKRKEYMDPGFRQSIRDSQYNARSAFYSNDRNIEEAICDKYAMTLLWENGEFILSQIQTLTPDQLKIPYPILVWLSCFFGLENLAILERREFRCAEILAETRNEQKTASFDMMAVFSSSLSRKQFLLRSMMQLLDEQESDTRYIMSDIYKLMEIKYEPLWATSIHSNMTTEMLDKYYARVEDMMSSEEIVRLLMFADCRIKLQKW